MSGMPNKSITDCRQGQSVIDERQQAGCPLQSCLFPVSLEDAENSSDFSSKSRHFARNQHTA